MHTAGPNAGDAGPESKKPASLSQAFPGEACDVPETVMQSLEAVPSDELDERGFVRL